MAQPVEFANQQRHREAFPYTALPRTVLDHTPLVTEPATEFWITDTTFRDGQQAREPFSPRQVLDIFDLLHAVDNGEGVIRKSEFFVYTESERASVEACRERGYQFPEVTAWIRARHEDLAIVKSLDLAETGMLTSVSDHHIFTKLGLDHQRAQDAYLRVVDAALEAGIRPRCHFEDVTRADIFGFVVPFAQALMRRSAAAGIPITIRLCDTMGVALPWDVAALPRGVPRLVHALRHEAGVPSAQLEWHGHNDFFKGHASAVTAWLHGCAAINCTLLGTGERTGNTPLEAALVDYVGLTGNDRLKLQALVELAMYMREQCGTAIPANYPLFGDECFSTRAGVHIDGLLKDPETYMSFDPRIVLGRPIGVVVSDKSGAAGIAWWVNEHFGLCSDRRVAKTHPGVQAIYEELMASYTAGRVADPTPDELADMASRHLRTLGAPGAVAAPSFSAP